MPPTTTTPTGLHTPVTNIVPTESTVSELISPGDDGLGDVLELDPGAVAESLPMLEAMPESAPGPVQAPDTSGLRDIGENYVQEAVAKRNYGQNKKLTAESLDPTARATRKPQ